MSSDDFAGYVRVAYLPIDPGVLKFLPKEIIERYSVVPLCLEGENLVIACTEPNNHKVLREIATAARRPIKPMLANIIDIRRAQGRLLSNHRLDLPLPGISEILYLLGHLSNTERIEVQQAQAQGDTEWRILTDRKLVNEEELTEGIGFVSGKTYLTLRNLSTEPWFIPLIPWETVKEKKVVPLWWFNGILFVGTLENESRFLSDELSRQVGFPISQVALSRTAWDHIYRKTYLRGKILPIDETTTVIRVLYESGRLSHMDRATVETIVNQTRTPLENILVERGLVTRDEWLEARASVYDVPLARYERKKELTSNETIQLMPALVARSFSAVPLRRENGRVVVGIHTPTPENIELLRKLTHLDILPEMMDAVEIQKKIDAIYPMFSRSTFYELPGFGNFLVTLGYITPSELEEVLAEDDAGAVHLGDCLVRKGYLSDQDVAQALSLYTGVPYAHLDYAHFEKKYVDLLSAHVARQCGLIPIWASETDLWVATADPLDGKKLRMAEAATGLRIWPLIAPRGVISAAINRFYGVEIRKIDARIISLVEKLVEKGVLTQTGASKVLQAYSEEQVPLDRAITVHSHFTEYQALIAVADVLNIQPISLQLYEAEETIVDPLGNVFAESITHDPVDMATAGLIDAQTARNLSTLPVKKDGGEIVVAFANPEFHADLSALQAMLGFKVTPRLAGRTDLEEAIHRTLEKGNIGSRLLLAGIINRKQLNDALDLAKRTGVRLGRALINRRYVTHEQITRFLAEQANIPFGTLEGIDFDQELVDAVGPEAARKHGILPVRGEYDQVILAVVDPFDEEAIQVAKERLNRKVRLVMVTEQELEAALEKLFRHDYVAQSVSELLRRYPKDSAYWVLSKGQKLGLMLFLILSIVWVYFDYRSYFIVLNILATFFYVTFSAYRFYLIYKAISRDLEIPVSDEEIAALDDRDLPVYTVLIPVYHESDVLVDLLDAVRNMDYPTTKMDIKVLMEEDDEETIRTFQDWDAPSHFEGIVVPYAEPKTKPKACNYGLIHARGEYVVIYDAEDKPDKDQLKRIYVAFSKAPPEVVCIQAKLNYYNRHQNLLTRWFTVEYSMWFDLFLPGLDASKAPIPLGGTSNHFRRDALIEAGAWDPYNVTEDADLGIRIHKRGYKTAIVDSTTYEEANSHVYNWIRQRSRWIKGYIQTWLVHMRDPLALIRSVGFKSFLSFQFVVGGTFFSALVNPIYWILTTLWFFFEWDFIQQIFPGLVFYFGAICLFVGNFAFTYMNVAGAMRRGYHDMVKHALLSPLYWGLASVAAWRGFYQLITKPYFWEKTVHGLYEAKVEPELGPELESEIKG